MFGFFVGFIMCFALISCYGLHVEFQYKDISFLYHINSLAEAIENSKNNNENED